MEDNIDFNLAELVRNIQNKSKNNLSELTDTIDFNTLDELTIINSIKNNDSLIKQLKNLAQIGGSKHEDSSIDSLSSSIINDI